MEMKAMTKSKNHFFSTMAVLLLGTIIGISQLQQVSAATLGIEEGKTYTFNYSIMPTDQSHSPLAVNIPAEVTNITNITATQWNVTYIIRYKVLVDNVPRDRENVTTITLSKDMNVSSYVINAKSPWELLFICNKTAGNPEVEQSVNLTASNTTTTLGTGIIKWDGKGILKNLQLLTTINGSGYVISITTGGGGGAVPGFPTLAITCVMIAAIIPVIYKVVKRAKQQVAIV
jgi:hypothetical protein